MRSIKAFYKCTKRLRVGYETAVHLARLSASRLILAVRDTKKGNSAAARIRLTVPEYTGNMEVHQVDQSSFASVMSFIETVQRELDRLDMLILNAGTAGYGLDILQMDGRRLSKAMRFPRV